MPHRVEHHRRRWIGRGFGSFRRRRLAITLSGLSRRQAAQARRFRVARHSARSHTRCRLRTLGSLVNHRLHSEQGPLSATGTSWVPLSPDYGPDTVGSAFTGTAGSILGSDEAADPAPSLLLRHRLLTEPPRPALRWRSPWPTFHEQTPVTSGEHRRACRRGPGWRRLDCVAYSSRVGSGVTPVMRHAQRCTSCASRRTC